MKKGVEIGTYSVRAIGKKRREKILHAHHTASGKYKLVAYDDGRFEYIPEVE